MAIYPQGDGLPFPGWRVFAIPSWCDHVADHTAGDILGAVLSSFKGSWVILVSGTAVGIGLVVASLTRAWRQRRQKRADAVEGHRGREAASRRGALDASGGDTDTDGTAVSPEPASGETDEPGLAEAASVAMPALVEFQGSGFGETGVQDGGIEHRPEPPCAEQQGADLESTDSAIGGPLAAELPPLELMTTEVVEAVPAAESLPTQSDVEEADAMLFAVGAEQYAVRTVVQEVPPVRIIRPAAPRQVAVQLLLWPDVDEPIGSDMLPGQESLP